MMMEPEKSSPCNTEHNVQNIKQSRYSCDQCQSSFTNNWSLTRHKKSIHEGVKLHSCNQCEKSFYAIGELNRHLRKHTGEKPYTCNQCNKSFSSTNGLRIHRRSHTGEKPFKCNHCEKSFAQQSHLSEHVKRIHTEERESFQCDECEKSFFYKESLQRHKRTHTEKKPTKVYYTCDECQKTFERKYALDVHILRIHKGEIIHKKEKKHPCDKCDQSFTKRGSLNVHMKNIHTRENPHKCNYCEESFFYHAHLKRHLMKIHKRPKPFSCEKCSKGFYTVRYYRKHKKSCFTSQNIESKSGGVIDNFFDCGETVKPEVKEERQEINERKMEHEVDPLDQTSNIRENSEEIHVTENLAGEFLDLFENNDNPLNGTSSLDELEEIQKNKDLIEVFTIEDEQNFEELREETQKTESINEDVNVDEDEQEVLELTVVEVQFEEEIYD